MSRTRNGGWRAGAGGGFGGWEKSVSNSATEEYSMTGGVGVGWGIFGGCFGNVIKELGFIEEDE